MGFKGKFDKDKRTVSITAVDLDREGLGKLCSWLSDVSRWVDDANLRDQGGWHWVFQRGHDNPPTAKWMRGDWAMASLELVQVTLRKARKCPACGVDIAVGTRCWRQGPGQYAGHSRDRFCERCVERGSSPRPPTLRLCD